MNGELGPDDVPFVRVRQLCSRPPGPVSPCCAVAPGLAGSQYSVAAGQWRAAIVDALPMSRCGEFRVFGRQWQFNVRAVGVHGPHETHARNKGGWHHASASPKFQPALDRPPASPSQLLPDNLTTPAFPGSLFHPSFRPNHTSFASADFCDSRLSCSTFWGPAGSSFLGCSAVAAAFA